MTSQRGTRTWCHGPACPLGPLPGANFGQLELFLGIIMEAGFWEDTGDILAWREGGRAPLPANQSHFGLGSLNPSPAGSE